MSKKAGKVILFKAEETFKRERDYSEVLDLALEDRGGY